MKPENMTDEELYVAIESLENVNHHFGLFTSQVEYLHKCQAERKLRNKLKSLPERDDIGAMDKDFKPEDS